MAVAVDWLPTLLELWGAKPAKHKIDGFSLSEVIKSDAAASRHKTFHWQSGRGLGGKPQWAVRQGDWKLIGNPNDTSNKALLEKNDQMFLISLSKDVGEQHNVAADHPDVVQRLTELHQQWLRDVSSQ